MPQVSDGPRKKEFIGIPIDLASKQRLQRVAKQKGQKPTVVARDYIVAGVERDEKKSGK